MSMNYLGDFKAASTVQFKFTTSNSVGGAVAPSSAFEAADLIVYKNGSATQRTSASGITMTSPFDSIVGLHHVDIDLSDNTDSGFWAAGNDYHVVLSPDETVDSQTVAAVVASFSIGNRALSSDYDFAKGTVAMTEAYNTDGAAPTPVQALFLALQRLTEFSISGTTITIKKLDGSTTAATLTLNAATAPTSSTRAT